MLIPFGILSAAASFGPVPRISVAGYVAGGSTGSQSTTVDKFLLPSESRSTLGTGLSAATSGLVGLSNSNVAGYTAGGFTTVYVSTLNKFAFPSDTRSSFSGLSIARSDITGFSNSGVAGYATGGEDGAVIRPTVDKLTFATDVITTLGTGLSLGAFAGRGWANQGVAGYVALGSTTSGVLNTVDKFALPAETRTTLGTGLGLNIRYGAGAFADNTVAGYFTGGIQTGGGFQGRTAVDKFAFPSDTRSTLGTGLAAATGNGNSGNFQDTAVAGYQAGGSISTGSTDVINRFAFPSDTRSTLGTGLSSARNATAAFSNEGAF
jgi:hypothetical protein